MTFFSICLGGKETGARTKRIHRRVLYKIGSNSNHIQAEISVKKKAKNNQKIFIIKEFFFVLKKTLKSSHHKNFFDQIGLEVFDYNDRVVDCTVLNLDGKKSQFFAEVPEKCLLQTQRKSNKNSFLLQFHST